MVRNTVAISFPLPLISKVIPHIRSLYKRHGRIGVVLFELEDFTSFREEHGSRAGDIALASIGRMFRTHRFCLGSSCSIFPSTLGGDDFLIFFPDCGDRNEIGPHLERLHREVSEEIARVCSSLKLPRQITVHMGYAEISGDFDRPAEVRVYEAVKEAALMAKSGLSPRDFLSREEILAIIKEGRIHAVYQPIVSLSDGHVLGYEALARGPLGSRFESPTALFTQAAQHNVLFKLEALCRRQAIEGSREFIRGRRLFLNVDPRVIHDPDFKSGITRNLIEEAGLSPKDIVLELTERSAIQDYKIFSEALVHYRRQGYALAIDDAGSGYPSLQAIMELQPLYVKIDRSIIQGIHNNPAKKAMARALVQVSRDLHCYTIAEGVEEPEELEYLLEIEVDYAQGYLIGKPAPTPPDPPADILARLKYKSRPTTALSARYSIKDLIGPCLILSPDAQIEEALQLFSQEPRLRSIVVAEGRQRHDIKGLIMREKLMGHLASRYGFALYGNKPVENLMEPNVLMVDANTPIERLAHMIARRPEPVMNDDVLVFANSSLLGSVTVRSVIERMAQIQIKDALAANPLTGLPGNLAIEATLKSRFEEGQDLAVLYIDLDNFKAYNDRYGFERGDEVILFTAHVISTSVKEEGNPSDIVGHIGGDDFIVLTTPDKAAIISRKIISLFDAQIPMYYDVIERSRGYIVTTNRLGQIEKYPIMSISVAVVTTPLGVKSHLRFGEIAAELKRYLKTIPGSKFMIDRRKYITDAV